MTFGIPTESLPMTNNSAFPLENHREWLEERRQAEREAKDTRREITTILAPCPLSEAIVKARQQPKSPEEEKLLADRYGSMPLQERAFAILYDLGMVEMN
jgi:hypothetical protein